MRLVIPLTLAALLAPSAVARAEEPESAPAPPPLPLASDRAWSVSLGTGAGGYVEFVDSFASMGPGGYDSSSREDRLQVNGRVDRELNRWFRGGLAWTFNRWTDAFFDAGVRVGSIDNTVHVLMVDTTLRWIRSERFELYSALAIGAGRWKQVGEGIGSSQDGVTTGFAFQIRYAGLSAGNDRFRAFVELGLGFEGLIVGGLTLRL